MKRAEDKYQRPQNFHWRKFRKWGNEEYPSLPRYIFLPAHARIFPWAGKNKSGYMDGKKETKFRQNASRHVDVIPLYAMSNLCKRLHSLFTWFASIADTG